MEYFSDKVTQEMRKKRSILCVGLDPQKQYIPDHILKEFSGNYYKAVLEFNKIIIDNTYEFAVAFKPNIAFYQGSKGIWALEETIKYIRMRDPNAIIICDAKVSDGGDSAKSYAETYIGADSSLAGDSVTVMPWIGMPTFQPFLDIVNKDISKGMFVVAKTSFKPESPFQYHKNYLGLLAWNDLAILCDKMGRESFGENGFSNVGVVMGATYDLDAPKMRELTPNSIMLVPGFKAQGATALQSIAGISEDGLGILVNCTRALIYRWHKKYAQPHDNCTPEKFGIASQIASIRFRDELNDAIKHKIGKYFWE